MAILKQGDQYNDTAEPTEPIEPAPAEEHKEKAKKKKLSMLGQMVSQQNFASNLVKMLICNVIKDLEK